MLNRINNGPVIIDTDTPEEGFNWKQFGIRIGICLGIIALSCLSSYAFCKLGSCSSIGMCKALTLNTVCHSFICVAAVLADRFITGSIEGEWIIIYGAVTTISGIITSFIFSRMGDNAEKEDKITTAWKKLKAEQEEKIKKQNEEYRENVRQKTMQKGIGKVYTIIGTGDFRTTFLQSDNQVRRNVISLGNHILIDVFTIFITTKILILRYTNLYFTLIINYTFSSRLSNFFSLCISNLVRIEIEDNLIITSSE